MQEEWYKLWEYEEGSSKYWVPGDTIYVSNNGRVKLNEELMTIGHGLWIDTDGDIHIVGRSFGKYNTIYRFVYTMCKEPEFNGGRQWQIHHIDHDHTNNHIDNLIKVTVQEHLKIHSTDQFDSELLDRLSKLHEYYNEQYNNHNKYIADTKSWYKKRYKQYKAENKLKQQLENNRIKQERIEQRKIQKQKHEQELIDNGTHFRASDGRLMSYQQLANMKEGMKHRDNTYVRTEEYRQKQRENVLRLQAQGKCKGIASNKDDEEERKRKIRESLKRYWSNPENRKTHGEKVRNGKKLNNKNNSQTSP